MKELSIEEKARRYDEAKYIMKEYLESGNAGVIAENTIKKAFPELVESEDEKIRKELLQIAKKSEDSFYMVMTPNKRKHLITWLEKQGERKSDWSEDDTQYINDTLALLSFGCSIHSVGEVQEWLQSLSNRVQLKQEWSEEDENTIQVLKNIVRHSDEIDENIYTMPLKEKLYDWLKSIKNRVHPEQEWSKEDERLFQIVIDILDRENHLGNISHTDLIACVRKLKSLKPHSQWKPSEEQMMAIETAINVLGKGTLSGKQLIELQEDLKKLKW